MPSESIECYDGDGCSVRGFLAEFRRLNDTMQDHAFAFFLGAGASVASGIPTGSTLAEQWVSEIYEQRTEEWRTMTLEAWATAENIGISGFKLDDAASFYHQIYDVRFHQNPESGYAYLEHAMSGAEPSVGYSLLAQVLATSRHKVVITTNFDNLIADALSLYTDTFPLVCGHESLTGFVRARLRRPLVCKIHRDLLLAPKSDAQGTARLNRKWAKVLKVLLGEYTPVVVGYGGNDGSVMEFLEDLRPGEIKGGIYWCYCRSGVTPNDRIRRLVARHGGVLIPILGFDELMMQIGAVLKLAPRADDLEERARRRAAKYRDSWQKLGASLKASQDEATKPVHEAFAEVAGRERNWWWAWELRARGEADLGKREEIYRQGLKECGESPELTGYFALFLTDTLKQHDEAEKMYRHALELDPQNVVTLGNFASFLTDVRHQHDDAERTYRRALELDPSNKAIRLNLAGLLHHFLNRCDEAEKICTNMVPEQRPPARSQAPPQPPPT